MPTVPTLAIVDKTDGTGATATVSGSDPGTTNRVYTMLQGASSWSLGATISDDGSSDLALSVGWYWGHVTSDDGAGTVSYGAPIAFVVTDADAATVAHYRVTGITESAGANKKSLSLERIEHPIAPWHE